VKFAGDFTNSQFLAYCRVTPAAVSRSPADTHATGRPGTYTHATVTYCTEAYCTETYRTPRQRRQTLSNREENDRLEGNR